MTIFFPDVSRYTPSVDVSKYPVVIAKATMSDGTHNNIDEADPTYLTYKAAAAAAGTVFAAYHWLNHGNLKAQAAWCFQHVGPAIPVMIDAEDKAGNTGYNGPLTVADLTGFAAEYRALGGTCSLAYLPFWYWSGAMSMQDLTPLNAAGLHLVSSNYPNAGYTDTGPGWASYGGATPVQWQYTSTPIDMNAYRGTVDEYVAMIGADMVDFDQARLTAQGATYDGYPDQTKYGDLAIYSLAGVESRLTAQLTQIAAKVGAAQPIDLDTLAGKVAAALVASNANGLTEADHTAVKADVAAVLAGAHIVTS